MKLENQVGSLELAKKLKELGCPQESLHYWQWIEAHRDYELDNGSEENQISAFTVAELGEMLPTYIQKDEDGPYFLSIKVTPETRTWHVGYSSEKGNVMAFRSTQAGLTEANARAKCLIYLLENKLI